MGAADHLAGGGAGRADFAGPMVFAQTALRKLATGALAAPGGPAVVPAPPPSALSIFNLSRCAPAFVLPAMARPATLSNDPYFKVNWFNGSSTISASASNAFRPDLSVPPPGAPSRPATPPPPALNWFSAAFCLWLAGVAFLGLRLFWRNSRFRSRLARCQPARDARALRLFVECRDRFGISRPVTLIESEEVESPGVYGLWRAWLLLPEGIFERFSDDELRHIFLHELAHLKRADLAINWLVACLQALHWFNPVLWLAWARMRADRELAADALALAHVREIDHTPYGETILKVVEGLSFTRRLPGIVGIVEDKARLKERLIAINHPAKTWKWAALAAPAMLAAVGLTRAQTENSPLNRGASGNHTTPAGQYGRITGAILSDASPVVGLRVGIAALSGKQQPDILQQAATDAGGHFNFDQVPAGTWTLFRMEPGKNANIFSALLDPVGVRPNETLRIEITDQTSSMPFSSKMVSSDCHGDLSGTVVEPSGHPAARAQVMVLRPGLSFALSGKPVLFNPESGHLMREKHDVKEPWSFCTTDERGHFFLNDIGAAWALVAADENGFIEVPLTNLTVEPSGASPAPASFAANKIKLEKWGRIEGTFSNYNMVVANEAIHVSASRYDLRDWFRSSAFNVESDEQGRFSISFVPPGFFALFAAGMREAVQVKPGQSSVANLGGNGRPVIGKLRVTNPGAEIDWSSHHFTFSYFSPIHSHFPPDLPARFKSREELNEWRMKQDEPRPLDVDSRRGRQLKLEKDGSFRIEQDPPGKYELFVSVSSPDVRKPKLIGQFGVYDRTFDVPASQSGLFEPFDLGVIELTMTSPPEDPAP